MFKVTAFCCSDGRHCEWTTDDKRAAEFLIFVLRKSEEWADAKLKLAADIKT